MSKIINLYKNVRTALAKQVRVFGAGENAAISKAPLLPNWYQFALLGIPRGLNAIELRQFAKSSWVQMVKRTIKSQIMGTDWDVVLTKEDEDLTPEMEELIKTVKTFLKYPNRNGDTFWMVFGAFLDDVMDLDSGVIWKGKNSAGELKELFAYDGSRFLIALEEHGLIEKYWQYSYKAPRNAPLPFEKEDIMYGKLGVNTDNYPYGWSPLQSIQQEVELLIQSTRWNKEYYKNNATPDGIVTFPGEQDALDRVKTGWKDEMQGKPHKLAFINNPDMKFVPLSLSNKDMEWLEGQKWYFHLVFAAYGLSPAEAGFYEDVNRSAQEGQERVSVKNAIKPYLELIAEKINREVIPDLTGGSDEIKFAWFPDNTEAEKEMHVQTMAKLNANVITINEVRKMEGLDPVEWGDQPIAITTQERAIESQEKMGFNSNEEKKDDSKEKKDNPKDKKEKPMKPEQKAFMQKFMEFIKNDK